VSYLLGVPGGSDAISLKGEVSEQKPVTETIQDFFESLGILGDDKCCLSIHHIVLNLVSKRARGIGLKIYKPQSRMW
jgi:hypothetical protein